MLRLRDLLHGARRIAPAVGLLPDLAVAMHLDVQLLGERVHDGDADAVQAARHLVAAAAELTAGVEHGVDDLERGLPRLWLFVGGDAAAVVGDRDGLVGVDDDVDPVADAGHGLVDGVVEDLPDEVVETAGVGRPDVHARRRTACRPSRTWMSFPV